MKRKLAAVVRSYIVNPWLVFGALLYCVVACFAVVVALNSAEPAKTESIFDSREDFTQTLHHPKELIAWEANPARFKYTKGISIEPTANRVRTAENGTSSNSKSIEQAKVELMEMDTQSLESLTRLTFLRTLELNGVKPTPELWQAIGELKELRRLTVRVPVKMSLSDLPFLPNLELLSVSSIEPSELALLKKLPRLRSMEVADTDFIVSNGKSDSPSKLATLHELFELREIIINPRMGLPDKMPEVIQTARTPLTLVPLPISPELATELLSLSNLRRIAIGKRGANSVPRTRDEELDRVLAGHTKSIQINGKASGGIWIVFIDFMLSALLITILNSQLLVQFSSPMSMLVPDYKRPHLLIPLLFLFAHIALFSFLRAQVHGARLIPSVAESSCFLLLLCVLSLGRYTNPILMFFANLFPLMIIFVLPMLMPKILTIYNNPNHRLFLLGEYPEWAIGILIAQLGLLWFVVKQISRWPKTLAFSNRIDNPFGHYITYGHSNSPNSKSIKSRSKRLHTAIVDRQHSLRKSITLLWNAGLDRPSLKSNFLPMAQTAIFYVALIVGIGFRDTIEFSWLATFVLPALLFIGIYSLLLKSWWYASNLLARQPMFQSEAVLPLSKSTLRTIRMKGHWVEIWPWLIGCLNVACAGTVVRVLWPAWLQVSTDTIWLSCFHCLSSVVLIWGLGLYLLTVRGSADRRLVAYPLVLSWAAGTFCMAYYRVQGISSGALVLEWIAVLCPSVVGTFLAYRAWASLPQMETGRIN